MQSRIPLPTDNIYKFYALFGLLLFLACIYAFVNIYQTYNEKLFKRHVEIQTLQDVKSPSAAQIATKEVLEKQSEIDSSDKKTYLNFIGIFLSVAIGLMIFGFHQWHTKIQPLQDEAFKKNLEKTELEIRALKKQINQRFTNR